jgi:tetratricopeptide (TPR) repeat protein
METRMNDPKDPKSKPPLPPPLPGTTLKATKLPPLPALTKVAAPVPGRTVRMHAPHKPPLSSDDTEPEVKAIAEEDLLDPSIADVIAVLDAELALLDETQAEQKARLELAAARLFEAGNRPDLAEQRLRRAHAILPSSSSAIHELRIRARRNKSWSEVLELLRSESKQASSKARRLACLEELGRLLRRHGSLNESREALEAVLDLDPNALSALEALRLQQSLNNDFHGLELTVKRLSEQTEDPPRQFSYRLLAAWLADHGQHSEESSKTSAPRFTLPGLNRKTEGTGQAPNRQDPSIEPKDASHDPERSAAVIEAYLRAFYQTPSQHAALFGVDRLLVGSKRWEELFRATVRHAQANRDPREVHAHLLRAGFLALEKLEDIPSAIKCFESALSIERNDELSLRMLIDIYARIPELREKQDASFVRLLGLLSHPDERFPVLLRRADLLLAQGSTQACIDTLLEAEQLCPERIEPTLRLRALLLEAERIGDWVDVCWRQAERDTEASRAERFVEIALVCEQHGLIDKAISAYREALHAQTGMDSALRALETLLRRKRDYAALAQLLESQLEAQGLPSGPSEASQSSRRAAMLWELASIYEHKLDKLSEAIDKLGEYRKLRPDDRAGLWTLQRLHQQKNMVDELAQDLLEELELENDAAHRAQIQLALARHEEYRKLDPKAAILRYRAALKEQPSLLCAHDGLRRLLRQERQWAALVDALEHRLSLRPAREHAEILMELGQIREFELSQYDNALESYERARQTDRAEEATEALLRLHQQRQRWPQVLELLQLSAQRQSQPVRKANAHFRAAMLFAERFEQGEQALSAAKAALEAMPEHTPSQQLLERLLARQEKWTELCALLDIQNRTELSPDCRADMALRQSVLLAFREHNHREALAPLELALGLSPEMGGLRPLLETILAGLGEHNTLAIRLAEHARSKMPPNTAVALIKSAADLHSMELGNGDLDLLENILRLAPQDQPSIERLEAQQSSHAGRVELLRRRLQVADGDEHAELRLDLAFALRITQAPAALDLLEELLAQEPRHWPALQLAAELALSCEKKERACDFLENQAALAIATETKIGLYKDVAKLAASMGHLERARNALLAAFKLAPERADIYAALRPLFETEQLWSALARVLRQHIDALPPANRVNPLFELCELRRMRLEDLEQAVSAAEQALELDPQHRLSLERLASMESQQQHWVEANDAYRRLLALEGPTPVERREWQLAQATLLDEHLARPDDALPLLLDLLDKNPDDKQSLRLIGKVYQEKGLFEDAILILDKLASLSAPAEAARTKVQQARLSFALGAERDATDRLKEVAALLRKDVAALDPLLAWADAEERHELLVGILDEQVMAASTAAMAESLAPVRMALARILGSKLNDRRRAEHESALAAMSAPLNIDAQLLAARYHSDPATARRFANNVINLDPYNIDAYYVCARSFEQLAWPDSLSRCNQVLCVLGEDSPLVRASANELVEPQSTPPSQYGPKALASCIRHPKLPDWAIELLSRAGPRAQIFVLPPLQALVPCPNEHPVKPLAFQLAALFGARDFDLAITRVPDFLVGVDPEKPERLVLGPRALLGNESELRFFLGMGIATQVLGTMYLELLDNRDLLRLLQGLIGLAHDGSGEIEVVKQLGKFLPRKNRKAVAEYAEGLDYKSLRLDLAEWRRAHTLTSRRAGLLASKDTRAAVDCLLRKHGHLPGPATSASERLVWLRQIPDAGELLSFSLSEHLAQARRLLNLNRDPQSAETLLS